jgi:hypothetical protein
VGAGSDDEDLFAGDEPTVITAPPVAEPVDGELAAPLPTTVAPPAAPPSTEAAEPSTTAAPTTAAPAPTTAAPPPSTTPPRLLVVGDSVAVGNGRGMAAWAERTGRMQVDVAAAASCTLLTEGTVVFREGWTATLPSYCRDLPALAVDLATANGADAIVVFIGSIQLSDWVLPGTEQRVGFGDPGFDAAYAAAADAALARLSTAGVPVLVATVPVPAWDPNAMHPDSDPPGQGEATMNDAARTAALHRLTAEVAARHPLVRFFPWAERLDLGLRFDGLHIASDAMGGILDAWLDAELESAYRDALAAAPPPRATTWSDSG